MENPSRLAQTLKEKESEIVRDWLKEQMTALSRRGVIKEAELQEQCSKFISALAAALQKGRFASIDDDAWTDVRDILRTISESRGVQGFTPTETAIFVFSLKPPFFKLLRTQHGSNAQALADDILLATDVLDRLGLYTTEVYQKTREQVISRQQQDLLELSTPVVKLWNGILALPLVGTLDSARTQVVMESLLQKIIETESEIAIIDITGVPTVDTLVAQHLLKTITAARLMGADCIISGIRPQIAQTIVHLGVELGAVTTKANLADAFIVALSRIQKKKASNASAVDATPTADKLMAGLA